MSENIAEMMKNTIAAVLGTGEKEYIVKGAKLKCTLGSTPSLLNLPICHGAYATGQPLIHANDNTPIKNILPFGTCPVLGGPCVPSIVGPWLNTHEKLMIADAAPGGPSYPAVTMKSFLVCSNGGIIEPQKSGQEYKTPGTAKTLEGQGGGAAGGSGSDSDEKDIPNTGRNNTFPTVASMLSMPRAQDTPNPVSIPGSTAVPAPATNDLTEKIDAYGFVKLIEMPGQIVPPKDILQSKTWWCYTATSLIMCKDCIKEEAKKYINERVIKFNTLLKDFVENGTDPNTSGLAEYSYTSPDGSWAQSSYTGLRSIAAGWAISKTGQKIYLAHPIQQFVVEYATNRYVLQQTNEGKSSEIMPGFVAGPKNNFGLSSTYALDFLSSNKYSYDSFETSDDIDTKVKKILEKLEKGAVIVNAYTYNDRAGHSLVLTPEKNEHAMREQGFYFIDTELSDSTTSYTSFVSFNVAFTGFNIHAVSEKVAIKIYFYFM